MGRYLGRKILIYALTFFLAVTIDWMIPRFMPGDPVSIMIARIGTRPEAAAVLRGYFIKAFGLDVPLWQQYLNFWKALFQGDLGVSIWLYPQPVIKIIQRAIPYDLFILLPAILLSWFAGNQVGALAARARWLDNTILPLGYLLTATPYMWLAIVLAWSLGNVAGVFPIAGAYSFAVRPNLSLHFILDLLHHWFLPFLSLFLVMFGGWAIGMRNMIIYELESDYSRYLEALGIPPDHRPGPPVGRHRRGRRGHRGRLRLSRHRLHHPQRGPESGLLPAAGVFPVHHHRRPAGELHD